MSLFFFLSTSKQIIHQNDSKSWGKMKNQNKIFIYLIILPLHKHKRLEDPVLKLKFHSEFPIVKWTLQRKKEN